MVTPADTPVPAIVWPTAKVPLDIAVTTNLLPAPVLVIFPILAVKLANVTTLAYDTLVIVALVTLYIPLNSAGTIPATVICWPIANGIKLEPNEANVSVTVPVAVSQLAPVVIIEACLCAMPEPDNTIPT